MAEANNRLNIKYHGVTMIQTQDNELLSIYNDDGDELDYPTLTNEQANYISTEFCKRIRQAMTTLVEELREYKAAGNPPGSVPQLATKPGSGIKG